jgi:hypothetical protein
LLLLPCLPTVMMKFPFGVSYTALLWVRVMEMLRFLFCAKVFLVFTPPPPLLVFDLNLPCRLVAAADAFLGMVYTDLLLLAGRPIVSTLMAFVPIKGSTPTLQHPPMRLPLCSMRPVCLLADPMG